MPDRPERKCHHFGRLLTLDSCRRQAKRAPPDGGALLSRENAPGPRHPRSNGGSKTGLESEETSGSRTLPRMIVIGCPASGTGEGPAPSSR